MNCDPLCWVKQRIQVHYNGPNSTVFVICAHLVISGNKLQIYTASEKVVLDSVPDLKTLMEQWLDISHWDVCDDGIEQQHSNIYHHLKRGLNWYRMVQTFMVPWGWILPCKYQLTPSCCDQNISVFVLCLLACWCLHSVGSTDLLSLALEVRV